MSLTAFQLCLNLFISHSPVPGSDLCVCVRVRVHVCHHMSCTEDRSIIIITPIIIDL